MSGEGVFEALESVTRAVLEHFEDRMPDGRGGEMPGLGVPEGGLADALRGAEPEPGERSREPTRRASMELRLSQLPEQDPGEAAARVAVGDAAPHDDPLERESLPP